MEGALERRESIKRENRVPCTPAAVLWHPLQCDTCCSPQQASKGGQVGGLCHQGCLGLLRSGFHPLRGGGIKKVSFFCKYSAFAVVFLAAWLAEEEPGYIFKGASARLEASSYPHPMCEEEKGRRPGSSRVSMLKLQVC